MIRHKWDLKAQQGRIAQYQCKRCGTVKTMKGGNGFPTTTYVTMAQQHTTHAPPCTAAAVRP